MNLYSDFTHCEPTDWKPTYTSPGFSTNPWISLEEDYSKWKSQMFNSICKFFEIDPENPNPGVTKDGPHVPLFTIARLSADTPDLGKFYLGEFSAVGPRTWENPLLVPTNTALIPHKENKTGCVTSRLYLKIVPLTQFQLSQKTIPHDAKHPYYASLHESRSLFAEDIYDDFTYTSTKPLTPTTDYVVQKISQEAGRVRVRRECFHIDLDIQGSGYKYETGDHVGVWPHNDDDQVARLVMALKLGPAELDQVVSLSPNPDNITSMNAKVHFPVPCAIKTAFKYYLDLRQHVKQYHFHILSKYAIDPTEQKELVKVAQLRELYIRLVEQPQVTLAGVLEKFKSISLPIEVVLGELLYAIQVRYYSISSSAKEQPTKVGITAVVVRYVKFLFFSSFLFTIASFLQCVFQISLERASQAGALHSHVLPASPQSSLRGSFSQSNFTRFTHSSIPCTHLHPTLKLQIAAEPAAPGRHGRPRDRSRSVPRIRPRANVPRRTGHSCRPNVAILWMSAERQGLPLQGRMGRYACQSSRLEG